MSNRKILKWILIVLVVGLSFSCLAFLFINVNRPILQSSKSVPQIQSQDVRQDEREIVRKLSGAPWHGLRYISKAKEWRFYAVTGESRQIDLVVPFDLIKVFYLEADGGLAFTWAAAGLTIPGKGYMSVTSAPVKAGDLVEIALTGDYVFSNGVQWDLCDSEYCRLAATIDTILVLDDKGTGITNGFIRYGWEPPTWPAYGFLCWSIRPASEEAIVKSGQ